MLEKSSLSVPPVVCKCCTYVNVSYRNSTELPPRTKLVKPKELLHPSHQRPPEVQRIDVGGTALPGLTLETAKEHTRVSCGWPNARDACKARPTIEAGFGKAAPSQPSVATQAN